MESAALDIQAGEECTKTELLVCPLPAAALDTDDSYSFTFTAPGTYQYFCYIHSFMVGTIVVEAATGSNATR